MTLYEFKQIDFSLPVVAVSDFLMFPNSTLSFDPIFDKAIQNIELALDNDSLIFLTTFQDGAEPNDELRNLENCGVVCKIKQLVNLPNGCVRITCQSLYAAVVTKYTHGKKAVTASVIATSYEPFEHTVDADEKAYMEQLLETLYEDVSLYSKKADEIVSPLSEIDNLNDLTWKISNSFSNSLRDKMKLLKLIDPYTRAMDIMKGLKEDIDLFQRKKRIKLKVEQRSNKNQREYYIREEIKALQDELGGDNEYLEKIQNENIPEEVQKKLKKEYDKLAKSAMGSPEYAVISNYLDICLELPWGKRTDDTLNYEKVQKVLDEDHNGLEKVKDRIVEYIAAKQYSPELKNQIICLVGPPGVGKTSIGASIARAMNRKYVRVSLGGVRDESDIRGHRKTYVAAMPGRIINALIQAESSNPLILLDEIDKLTSDSHGDPTSALLEVLDSEQNKSFRDHFVELPVDLSDVLFIATANNLSNVPKPLLDRMEIIELGIYTKREKLAIVKDHLLPKQMSRHGLKKKMLHITDDAIMKLIDDYTAEAGVRQLERSIATICRKIDKKLLQEKLKSIEIDTDDIKEYMGPQKYFPEKVSDENEVGVVNGLAYTEVGGTLLKVEVAVMDGTGVIKTTGSLGEVMKESAQIAVSYVRTVADQYQIDREFYKNKDIHIHFPEGATPKDGPSAGITMVTALVSALSGKSVKHDIAMTGEISLRGKVLPIGGLKEKTMAAYTAGVHTVFIPSENEKDLSEIDELARDHMTFIPCNNANDVLKSALI